MAWPMMEWVLDTRYRELFAPGRIGERSIIVRGCGESQLIDLMNECLARYPRCKVFSLPRMQPDRHVELGVRGDAAQVATAIEELAAGRDRRSASRGPTRAHPRSPGVFELREGCHGRKPRRLLPGVC